MPSLQLRSLRPVSTGCVVLRCPSLFVFSRSYLAISLFLILLFNNDPWDVRYHLDVNDKGADSERRGEYGRVSRRTATVEAFDMDSALAAPRTTDSGSSSAAVGYDLPLFPLTLPEKPNISLAFDPRSTKSESKIPTDLDPETETEADSAYKKLIPRNIWVAVKDAKDELPGPLKEFFVRNPKWKVRVCDNTCKDMFMYTYFKGTSLLWAYNMINPALGASKADIWRYCVLYLFGGFYIDDDSDMKVPLDEIVGEQDRLIMSEEGASSIGPCYFPAFHLSDEHTAARYAHNASNAKHYTKTEYGPPLASSLTAPSSASSSSSSAAVPSQSVNEAGEVPTNLVFFHGNTLIQWAIFVAPGHPLMKRTLEHVVDIIKHEYLHKPVVQAGKNDVKFKTLICTTGFVLTHTLREMELQGALEEAYLPRISANNFKEYDGKVKAIWTGNDPSHYRKVSVHYLSEYAPFTLDSYLEHLEGKAVQETKKRDVWLIQSKQKRAFPDYETFLKMGFTDKLIKHVAEKVLAAIPEGPMIDSLMLPANPPPKSQAGAGETGNGAGAMSKPAENPVRQFASQEEGAQFLSNVTAQINNRSVECFSDDYAGTRDDFLNNVWTAILGSVPVMVYPFCAKTFQLGNTLGYYLNDVACAAEAGLHFVAVHKTFNLLHPETLLTKGEEDRLAFFNALPDAIIHPDPPQTIPEVKENMRKKCQCLQYCWENSAAPWIKRTDLVGKYVLPAIDRYVSVSKAADFGTPLSNVTDMLFIPAPMADKLVNLEKYAELQPPVIFNAGKKGSARGKRGAHASVSSSTQIVPESGDIDPFLYKAYNLPFIPNVTIQYRCGDNIGFGKTRYGLLPFSAFTPPRIDPSIADYIYVIADSPERQQYHAYSSRCDSILRRLFDRLKKTFPNAVVVVKRGGDLFSDYARLAYSNIVVCSASTFCLWPALANPHGQVHFPLTPLVGGAWTNESAPFLRDNFHWIDRPEMIKDFKRYRPWWKVMDDLESWT